MTPPAQREPEIIVGRWYSEVGIRFVIPKGMRGKLDATTHTFVMGAPDAMVLVQSEASTTLVEPLDPLNAFPGPSLRLVRLVEQSAEHVHAQYATDLHDKPRASVHLIQLGDISVAVMGLVIGGDDLGVLELRLLELTGTIEPLL